MRRGSRMDVRWPSLFTDYLTTSFVDLFRHSSPAPPPRAAFGVSPGGACGARGAALGREGSGRGEGAGAVSAPEGTTILALRYADGVVMAGDRQATEGYQVAHRRIEKVYKADEHSAVAIAGVAG